MTMVWLVKAICAGCVLIKNLCTLKLLLFLGTYLNGRLGGVWLALIVHLLGFWLKCCNGIYCIEHWAFKLHRNLVVYDGMITKLNILLGQKFTVLKYILVTNQTIKAEYFMCQYLISINVKDCLWEDMDNKRNAKKWRIWWIKFLGKRPGWVEAWPV